MPNGKAGSARRPIQIELRDTRRQARQRGGDPRPFFCALRKHRAFLDPWAGDHLREIVDFLRRARQINNVTIADLGCGYGLITAMIKYGLSLDEAIEHWTQHRVLEATQDEVREYDWRFFQTVRPVIPISTVGLDPVSNAVRYATEVGLIERGFAEDLDRGAPSAECGAALGAADLIFAMTGSPPSIEAVVHILANVDGWPPWFAAFVPNGVRYDHIERVLGQAGLVTEALPSNACLRLSRPAIEAQRAPITAI